MISLDLSQTPTVAILLSTYNGEKYLPELLSSLISQHYSNYEIHVRDDGSTDSTKEILKSFQALHQRIHVVHGENIGCVSSFLTLLRSVEASILMFCDQDDVWLPSKVSTAVHFLVEIGISHPILFHSDLVVADQFLNTIAPSFMQHQGITFPAAHSLEVLVVQNCVVGCTAAITSSLAGIVRTTPVDESDIAMHDWWLALIAKTQGQLVFSSKAEILYRQHATNISGAKTQTLWRRIRLQLSKEGLLRVNTYRMRVATQASTFLSAFQLVIDSQAVTVLKHASKLHPKNGLLPVLNSLRLGIKLQNSYMNISLIYTALITQLAKITIILTGRSN
jgi:glycosyltransferase involved in cell wall biosynthesis